MTSSIDLGFAIITLISYPISLSYIFVISSSYQCLIAGLGLSSATTEDIPSVFLNVILLITPTLCLLALCFGYFGYLQQFAL